MKKFGLALFAIFAVVGCSKPTWVAKIYVVKAENTATKAHAMRVDKGAPYEKRLRLYRAACRNFLKAYDYDPGVFTLYRIETATDSCLRVEDFGHANMFRDFEEKYAQAHPKEAKYGDAGPWMTLEG